MISDDTDGSGHPTLHVQEDATKRMTIATTDSNKTFVSTNRCLDPIPNLGASVRVGNGIITNRGLKVFPDSEFEFRRKMVA